MLPPKGHNDKTSIGSVRDPKRTPGMSAAAKSAQNKKIPLRLILGIIGLFLAFCGATAFLCLQLHKNRMERQAVADKAAVTLLASLLDEHEKSTLALLSSYASRILLINAVQARDTGSLKRHLMDLAKNGEDMDLLFVTDVQGVIWDNYPEFPEAIGKNVSDRDWFQGIRSNLKPYISTVFRLIVADTPLAVAACVPVRDSAGRPIGFLANSQRLEFIKTIIKQIRKNMSGSVSIIDRAGNLLYDDKPLDSRVISRHADYPLIEQALKREVGRFDLRGDALLRRRTLTLGFIKNLGWTVILERRLGDSLRSEYKDYATIAAIAFLLFLILGLLASLQTFLNGKTLAMRQKELILKETHHRVKNNMNTVSSLLSLQANRAENLGCKGILVDAANRMQSMQALYDTLYRSENYGRLSVKDFMERLVAQVVKVFYMTPPVRVRCDLQEIALDVKILSPLGIMINELVTNSMTYAFERSANPEIFISAGREGDAVTILYGDNGIGLLDSLTLENSSGFGMQLVASLAGQIGAEVRIERGQGTRYIIRFKAAAS